MIVLAMQHNTSKTQGKVMAPDKGKVDAQIDKPTPRPHSNAELEH
jgi:hypothetical protein